MSNSNLKDYLDDFFNDLELLDDFINGHNYKGLLKNVLFAFLDNENKFNAYEVYETFFMIYQITSEDKSEAYKTKSSVIDEPNALLDLVKIMEDYEKHTGDLIEKQRDHFIHSVNVFILGLAIYARNKKFRDKFRQYVINSDYDKYYEKFYKTEDGNFSNEEFLYRWGIAALFHDIGYPVEIIGKQMKTFINNGVKSISEAYNINTAIDFKNFDEFNSIKRLKPNFADDFRKNHPISKFLDLFKPTDIMAYKISCDFPEIDIYPLIKHLDNFVDTMGNNGFIDHGFFSSILVLNSYGYLIQKYAKNYDFFFYPIVDSATAILLHNYYNNVLRNDPFKLKQLHPNRNPLAFLLILCDELQEWNREPLGKKDREKSRVAELEIRIDEKELVLEYIVKSGAMGLGFSRNKESFLNDLLAIKSLFKTGLSISTEVSQFDVIKDMKKRDIRPPTVLLRNIEKLAIKIHEDYVLHQEEDGKEVERDFHKLSPELKMSNIRQAKSIATKLSLIGCEMVSVDDERDTYEFSDDEIIDLAIYEHEEWIKEKEDNGWIYGEPRDDENKIHPSLCEWVDYRYVPEEEAVKIQPQLSESEKMKDINAIKNIPNILAELDMKIVMSKLRLLTLEKHEFYKQAVKSVKSLRSIKPVASFDDLPYAIKFVNFRQTDVLVKSLGEIGCSLVSDDDPGNELTLFNDEQIEYLAKRDHRSWYSIKLNLGCELGPEHTDKINPNLVEWDELDDDVRMLNCKTFEELPKLCKNVGLKIVKE